jgi:diaminopropionate ammonia-lyase
MAGGTFSEPAAVPHLCEASGPFRYAYQAAVECAPAGFGTDQVERAAAVIESWPRHARTPLVELPDLAQELSLGAILYKDESERFGLGSFKPMGAVHAVSSTLAEAFGAPEARGFDQLRELMRVHGAPFALACASDGNHGRAVAWAAGSLGLPCDVFLHERVSEQRERAITDLGARTHRVTGTYDDAVRAAAHFAKTHDSKVISDTAYGGHTDIARRVMIGYAAIGREISAQLPGRRPTHLFCQAGVGAFAAAMFTYFRACTQDRHLRLICTEPLAAACLLESALAGQPKAFPGDLDTIMAGLACGEPSPLAWEWLRKYDCHFTAIGDACAAEAVSRLARAGLVAGESGAAGLAALASASVRPAARSALELDHDSVVLVIGTEGATDPECYTRLTGRSPESVAKMRSQEVLR